MLSNEARDALAAALVTKGQNKGRLLRNAPPSTTMAFAAWQGAMIVVNPFKASIAALMFMDDQQMLVRDEVEAHFRAMTKAERIAFDKDRQGLERLGVW